MIRRTARERRQYLHSRMQQLQEAQLHKKRQTLKRALDNDQQNLQKDIRDDQKLRKDFKFDEATELDDMDDEYRTLGEKEPKILITTSRDPSVKLSQFAKEFRLLIPNSQRINRGNHVIADIASGCRANEVSDLLILHETRGRPDALVISHFPYGPTVSFTLHNVSLRHDIPDVGNVSEAYPNIIIDKMDSKLGERIGKVLKALFPPSPKDTSPRVVTFANEGDFISFRNHVFVKTGGKSVELAEVGPRFELRLYEIKLGTIEQIDADVEYESNYNHESSNMLQVASKTLPEAQEVGNEHRRVNFASMSTFWVGVELSGNQKGGLLSVFAFRSDMANLCTRIQLQHLLHLCLCFWYAEDDLLPRCIRSFLCRPKELPRICPVH